jgi:hypothetical protein
MKTQAIPLILAVALLTAITSASRVSAIDYYVAVTGSDANDGLSQSNSWRNINHALTAVSQGDMIHVGPGTYSEWLHITNAVTLSGSDVYAPENAPLSRHQSLTIIRPRTTDSPESPVIMVETNGVVIQNLTIDGDSDTNSLPDAKCGVMSLYRPVTVSHCVIRNINGYGIFHEGIYPAPDISDDDSLRSHFECNMIQNISHTNIGQATGIYLDHAPATCASNEIVSINGFNANAGIYVYECFFTANMTDPLIVSDNYFQDCLTACWLNSFGTTGEKVVVNRNTITESVIGIRVTAAEGQALITGNTIYVGGYSPSSNTPARAIWIHADYDPWGIGIPARSTDHFIQGNLLDGGTTVADGTIGILCQYNRSYDDHINNGVLAGAYENVIREFDYGVYLLSGTNGVSRPHDPLVDMTVTYNSIYDNVSYGLFATGITHTINATTNWWGSPAGPTDPSANPVSTNVDYAPWSIEDVFTDSDNDGIPDSHDDDDDNDGMTDVDEGIAGTDPFDPLSCFKFLGVELAPGNWIVLKWPSAAGRYYALYRTTNLLQGFSTAMTNLTANPPTNSFTDTTAPGLGPYFYKVGVTFP